MRRQLVFSTPGPVWGGRLLIALALMIPASSTQRLADTPAAWFHNPSAWIQRAPLILLLSLGALVAKASPVLAGIFLMALTLALTGDRRRWRTAPWAVCLSMGAVGTAALCSAALLSVEPSVFAAGAGPPCWRAC